MLGKMEMVRETGQLMNRSGRRVAFGGEFLLPYPPSLSTTNYVLTTKKRLNVRIRCLLRDSAIFPTCLEAFCARGPDPTRMDAFSATLSRLSRVGKMLE